MWLPHAVRRVEVAIQTAEHDAANSGAAQPLPRRVGQPAGRDGCEATRPDRVACVHECYVHEGRHVPEKREDRSGPPPPEAPAADRAGGGPAAGIRAAFGKRHRQP